MKVHCPCCNTLIESLDVEDLAFIALSPLERRIVEALISSYPRLVTRDYIIDQMYWDDPDGGPLDAYNTMHVVMMKVRRKLSKFGWTISRGKQGPGMRAFGSYRLIKAAPA